MEGWSLARPIARLIDELSRLPGVGPKTASRLTFYLLKTPLEQVEALAAALLQLRRDTRTCEICFNISEASPCAICSSETRDGTIFCVVEEPLDVLALERTGRFRGRYHVLGGVISPVDGIGPEDLRIEELVQRATDERPGEVILATNPSMEGEATAMYLERRLRPLGVRLTRLARGLPVGGDLEYADDVTLSRALEGRSEV